MQNQFIESVPRSSLPTRIQNKLAETKYVRVIYEVDEESNMPPEKDIRPEFMKMLEESEKDIKDGDFVCCRTKKETDALFESIWNEDE